MNSYAFKSDMRENLTRSEFVSEKLMYQKCQGINLGDADNS